MKKLTILLTVLVVALVATGCPQPNGSSSSVAPSNGTTEPSVPLHEQGFDLETYDVSLKFCTPKLYKITLKGKLLDEFNETGTYPTFTFSGYDTDKIRSVEAKGSDDNKLLRIETKYGLGTTTIKMSAKDEDGNEYYRNIKVTVTAE